MKKAISIIVISMLSLIVGFVIGKLLLKTDSENEINVAKNEINLNKDKAYNVLYEVPIQRTNVSQEKISVNTDIVEITYYKECNHQIENRISNIKKYINMTKTEFQKEFPNWEIKEFSSKKVVLYNEEDDFCNEHFLVKNEDGFVTIYTIDNNEIILELLDKTEIPVKYLTNVDQNNLNKGIVIYTKQNLNRLIQDYE